MNTTPNVMRKEISPTALSIALLIGSLVWLAAASEWYVTGGFKSDASVAALPLMMLLLIVPSICFSIMLVLVDRWKRPGHTRLDTCALAAGIFPITLGTLLAGWVVKALFF